MDGELAIGSLGDGWILVAGVEGRPLPLFRGLCLGEEWEWNTGSGWLDLTHYTFPDQVKCISSQWGNFPSRLLSNRRNQFFSSNLGVVVWKVERKGEERGAVAFVHLVLNL